MSNQELNDELNNGESGLRILAVSGSMRDDSNSARLAKLILNSAQNHGAQTRLLDLREIDLPMFRANFKAEHSGRSAADEAVNWAQAFVLVTPDYHGSMSGAMKNFLDHYWWQKFAGKLFAYACLSHEKGLTVMDQMRTAIRQCYGWSLPYGVSAMGSDFDESGAMKTEASAARVAMLGRDLAVYGAMIQSQFTSDLQSDEASTFAAYYRS